MPDHSYVELPLDLERVGGQFSFPLSIGCIEALDPGGTTGWAFFNPTRHFISCGQLTGDHHKSLYDHLDRHYMEASSDDYGTLDANPFFEIVCESFEFRQHHGVFDQDKVELDSKEYIGVTKLYSDVECVPIHFQTASLAKHFVGDDKLRRLGWYDKTKGMVHARDALRHLIYYLIVVKRVTTPFTNKWLTRIK